MSSLHCLPLPAPCSSISKTCGINLTTQHPPNLSAKPSSLNPHNALHQNSPDLPLSLPDLSSDAREKILSLEIMGIDSSRALSLHPDLRAASPDSIHSVISFLLSKGIHHKDLGRILGMCPRVMTSSIGKDLVPVFKFLSCDLKIPDSEFRRVIKKCPRFLVCDVRDQLRPALIYLQRLGFKDVTALAFHDPVLFVSSVENTLVPKLQHLMGLGLSREEAVGMVLRCPSLLTFSIENNYKPKYEYFVREMGGGLEELKEFPQYFAFSLDKRIKLRHRVMAEMGLRLPLSLMLKSTDNEFKELLVQRGRFRIRGIGIIMLRSGVITHGVGFLPIRFLSPPFRVTVLFSIANLLCAVKSQRHFVLSGEVREMDFGAHVISLMRSRQDLERNYCKFQWCREKI